MTELALPITENAHQAWGLVKGETNERTASVIRIGVTLAFLQILDGLLTAIGVSHFGLGAEANLFIRYMMVQIGPFAALFILKAIAIVIVALLGRLALAVNWLPNAMRLMVVLYLACAIVPWSAILITKLL
jgi:hypothetical protein